MEQSGGLCELSIQQDVCPAPNEGPGAVDWLPQFAGFSWLAYGAHFSVVISMAPNPSNAREAAMGGFCKQVLSTGWVKEGARVKEKVRRVGWAPVGTSIGSLAAAAGNLIYLFGPKGLNSAAEGNESMPEVPLRWVNTQVLEHFSTVLSFAWSESGDGLLSVGPEIVMWQKVGHSWNCLWRSQLEQPHSLSSASWSARGIAATAEGAGDSVIEKENLNVDHLVKIWWWEDGKELLEVDLAHPQELLTIQWRPIRGFGPSDQSFRPVLLTSCRDGVVRLWAEIGTLGFPDSRSPSSGNTEAASLMDQHTNDQESQFKLAFFVSAVIDVNSALKGVLGHDIHVTWPEARGAGLRSSSGVKEDNSKGGKKDNSVVKKEGEVSSNEWLVGIGPSGSVALWSVQSLDDLSPARGPLVQLSHQRPGLLPSPLVTSLEGIDDIEGQRNLQAVKVVVHRPLGMFWGPPASMDVFETWSPHLLRWSCIWPPVAAIGGPTSKAIASNLGAISTVAAGGKLSTWGISSDSVYLGGHRGNIVQIAVHPIALTRLVASLDNQGMVLLWDSNGSLSNPRLEITGFLNPLWKLSGQLAGHRVNSGKAFNSMAWAPVLLEENDAVLLLGHSLGVDCYLISRKVLVTKGKPKSLSISFSLLNSVDWPQSKTDVELQGIYTLSNCSAIRESPHIRSCVAVGIGANGLKLVSWKLDIDLGSNRNSWSQSSQDVQGSAKLNVPDVPAVDSVRVGNDYVNPNNADPLESDKPIESERQAMVVDGRLLGFSTLAIEEQVTSIAVTTSKQVSYRRLEGNNNDGEIFDVITGCSDGALRLWKIWDDNSKISAESLEKAVGWQCVGLLRCYMGPVTKVAFCNGGSKIASTGRIQNDTNETVHIWGADFLKEECGFCLEGKALLPSPAVSVSWLDGGNGLFILGVATQIGVQLFSQCRSSDSLSSQGSGLSELNIWTCLASSSLAGLDCCSLLWETQGSLVVSCGGHILLYSNYVLASASGRVGIGKKFSDVIVGSSQLDVHGTQTSQAFLPRGNDSHLQSGVRLNEVDISDEGSELCSIVEAAEKIGCPLLDYHPTSILYWISGGYRHCARASVRHLASRLIHVLSSSGFDMDLSRNDLITDAKFSRTKVSRTPLTKMFHGNEQNNLGARENTTARFASYGNGQTEIGKLPHYLSSSWIESYGSFSPSSERGKDQTGVMKHDKVAEIGGFEPFTKLEIEGISNTVKDSLKVPGLLPDEKLQLLAIIDVLAEMDGVKQNVQIDGLDMAGQRFWLAVRFSFLFACRAKERNLDIKDLVIESKAMAWALQSEFKDTLLEICLHNQTLSWPAMRALGIGYWFTDGGSLRKQIEKVARAQFLEKKDPKSCALLYLALDRCSVLAGLSKLSKDQSDKPIADFLLRDFKDEKNQAAALKNAYVLMGKHRHELAAAFFILGGDGNSAAVVCAKNLGDVQLALVVSVLLEGAIGQIGRNIILKYALPQAKATGDDWLASLLQWLLGKGIESLEELSLQSHELSTPHKESIKETLEGLRPSPVFPMDSEIGSYCELLASKSRLRTSADANKASTLAKIAAVRSSAALRRSGLSLQMLELFRNAHHVNFFTIGVEPNFVGSSSTPDTTSPPNILPLTDIFGREVGSGWVSKDVVGRIQRAIISNLVLQTASQRLEDHPHWGKALKDIWIFGLLSKQRKNLKRGGFLNGRSDEQASHDKLLNEELISFFSEGADKVYEDDLQLLEKNYLVKTDEVAAALGTFAHIHHCHYIYHRLQQGLRSFIESSGKGVCLASKSAISACAAQNLEELGTEAPWVLARAVLACGGAAAAMELSNLDSSEAKPRKQVVEGKPGDQGGALQWLQVEELIRFGGEIQLLTSAASQGDSHFDKQRDKQAMTLLSFVFFVAAAWLGRKTKTLFELISPTVVNPSSGPECPPQDFDAVIWFQKLELVQKSFTAPSGTAAGKRPVEGSAFNPAGRVTIPSDDAWRVLGVTLWTHILIYVRKQLAGTTSESALNNFGRILPSQSQSSMKTSSQLISSQSKGSTFLGFPLQPSAISATWTDFRNKVRDGYQLQHPVTVASASSEFPDVGPKASKLSLIEGGFSSTDNDHFGAALLSSLTSIVAGLRKQLAAHLRYSLNKSDVDPLALWLWGKPSLNSSKQPNIAGNVKNSSDASTSNGHGVKAKSSTDVDSRPGPNLFPTAVFEMGEEVWKELWELLVVRDKVCSALGLEGVSGQRLSEEVGQENLSGWYLGRKGHLPATQICSTGTVRYVTATGKHSPRIIMWNAVKGGPSLSGEGATLKESKDGYRESDDGLHLSEEFTEGGMFAFGDTFLLH